MTMITVMMIKVTMIMKMIMITIVTKVKENNYCDLKYEIRRIRNCRSVQVISIAVGALGTVSRGFGLAVDTTENVILHGTFTANNRVGFRTDSPKSMGKGNRNSN